MFKLKANLLVIFNILYNTFQRIIFFTKLAITQLLLNIIDLLTNIFNSMTVIVLIILINEHIFTFFYMIINDRLN